MYAIVPGDERLRIASPSCMFKVIILDSITQMEAGVDTRVRVMLVGGLYGSQPVGRELVLRLARHLASGWAKKNREVQKLLQNTKIFLVPAVDIEGFDRAEPGCNKLSFLTFS